MKIHFQGKCYRILKEAQATKTLKWASDLGLFNGVDFDDPKYKGVFYKTVTFWEEEEGEGQPTFTMFFDRSMLYPILLIAIDPKSFNAHVNHSWL